MPWTQNIKANGNITTLYQDQRPQDIQSPIPGRIVKWYVKEGDYVHKGDTILKLSEIKEDYLDPNLVGRTQQQLDAKSNSNQYYKGKVQTANAQMEALEQAKELKINQLNNKLLQIENIGFVFTANLTDTGLEKGLEVGVKLNEQQTKDLNKIQTNWKKDFQSKAIKTANIKDLKELEVFKDGELIKKILLDDNKEEKRKIFKVSDLLSFFNQKPEFKDNSTKSLKLKLTAEIEILPKDFKTNGTDKFEVIEITEAKDKKTKVVVLKDSFTPNDIQQLNDLKELKIYFATT